VRTGFLEAPSQLIPLPNISFATARSSFPWPIMYCEVLGHSCSVVQGSARWWRAFSVHRPDGKSQDGGNGRWCIDASRPLCWSCNNEGAREEARQAAQAVCETRGRESRQIAATQRSFLRFVWLEELRQNEQAGCYFLGLRVSAERRREGQLKRRESGRAGTRPVFSMCSRKSPN